MALIYCAALENGLIMMFMFNTISPVNQRGEIAIELHCCKNLGVNVKKLYTTMQKKLYFSKLGFIFFVQTFFFCHLILGWNMEYEIYEPSVRTYFSLLYLNTILSMAPNLSLSHFVSRLRGPAASQTTEHCVLIKKSTIAVISSNECLSCNEPLNWVATVCTESLSIYF